MPIDRITADQFVTKLRTALLARTKKYDSGSGSIPDVILNPLSGVLEDLNNNGLRRVSLLLSLQNSTEFTTTDLDQLVFNEDLIRPAGSFATTVLTFKRSRPFGTSDTGLVSRGFPVGTSPNTTTGQAVTFVTTSAMDKTFATAVLDTTTNQTVYQLRVPAQCTIAGSIGSVGADQINRPLIPLVNYDSVTNDAASEDGTDTFTNDQLIQLYLLAVNSRQLSVSTGSQFYVLDNFPAVQDVHEVFGTDPELTRAASDAGAVDAYIIGTNTIENTAQLPFLGVGQLMAVPLPPLVRVDSVTRVSDNHVFTEGTDYEVIFDTSGLQGSTRAKEGIAFLPLSSAQITAGLFSPTGGDLIQIQYATNQLIRDLQSTEQDPEVQVEGRDLLYKEGQLVNVVLAGSLATLSTFNFTTVQNAVITAIDGYINGLGLGDTVEVLGILGAVKTVSGVQNFIITQLSKDPNIAGTEDLVLTSEQYPRIDNANLTISPF